MTIDQMIRALQAMRDQFGDIDVVLQNPYDYEAHHEVRGLSLGHYIGYQLYTPVVFIDHDAHLEE